MTLGQFAGEAGPAYHSAKMRRPHGTASRQKRRIMELEVDTPACKRDYGGAPPIPALEPLREGPAGWASLIIWRTLD